MATIGIYSIQCLRSLSRINILPPDFLVPALSCVTATTTASRPFSTTSKCESRIGAAPLSLPPEVNLTLLEPSKRKTLNVRVPPPKTVEVEGPLGKMSAKIPSYMGLVQDPNTRKVVLSIPDRKVRKHREMWGTTRAYLQNHILGVSEGHTTIIRLVGVGFRATIEKSAATVKPEYPGQEFVNLKVGYSHPIEMGLPVGVKASTPQPTRILLEGIEKEVVNQFAAEIRRWRKPEPYKGKGVFVNDETIKLKSKRVS